MSVFWEGEGGGVLAPPEEELVDASPVGEDLRRSATDSSIPVKAARVWERKKERREGQRNTFSEFYSVGPIKSNAISSITKSKLSCGFH